VSYEGFSNLDFDLDLDEARVVHRSMKSCPFARNRRQLPSPLHLPHALEPGRHVGPDFGHQRLAFPRPHNDAESGSRSSIRQQDPNANQWLHAALPERRRFPL
jgi:hypothetical protein